MQFWEDWLYIRVFLTTISSILGTTLANPPSLSSSGYKEGTFALIWKKRRGSVSSTEDEQELHEKSTATLFETGMEGGKEYLVIRKRDGVDLQRAGVSCCKHITSPATVVVDIHTTTLCIHLHLTESGERRSFQK